MLSIVHMREYEGVFTSMPIPAEDEWLLLADKNVRQGSVYRPFRMQHRQKMFSWYD